MLQTELQKDLDLITDGDRERACFPGDKSTGAGHKPLTPLCTKGYERLNVYLHKAKVDNGLKCQSFTF
jgi:hypothetical protein